MNTQKDGRKPHTTVFFLAHKRNRYLEIIAKELAKCSKSTKSQMNIHFLVDNQEMETTLSPIVFMLSDAGFGVKTTIRSRYLEKSSIIARSKSTYVVKHDEDIFMTFESWDYFIQAIPQYNFSTHPVVAPVISSGIPSVDLFLDEFLTDEQSTSIRKILEKVEFPNDFLGADYSKLSHLYKVDNYSDFYKAASEIEHVYKGIHPIRLSFEGQKALMDATLENINWMKPSSNHPNLVEVPFSPYFCNSIFVAKKTFYRSVIVNIRLKRLFSDGFDEVGLNQYLSKKNKHAIFDLNCVAIHPSYNTIGSAHEDLSNSFFERLEETSKKLN